MNFTKSPELMTPLELSVFEACGDAVPSGVGGEDGTDASTTATTEEALASDSYGRCSCAFHRSGENLQLLLRHITPDRCAEIHALKKKRRARWAGDGCEDGDDRKYDCDDNDHEGPDMQMKCQRVEAGGVLGNGDEVLEDNYEQRVQVEQEGSLSIEDVMGFGGFASSRNSFYDD